MKIVYSIIKYNLPVTPEAKTIFRNYAMTTSLREGEGLVKEVCAAKKLSVERTTIPRMDKSAGVG